MALDTKGPRAVIFTDLDGTLLDHETYDFGPARAALEEARRSGVPVVLCSSKTRSEILAWQARLRLTGPFISENGGGVFLSGGGVFAQRFPEVVGGVPAMVFGTPYAGLRRALQGLRRTWGEGLRGFGDMADEEIAALTGLPEEEARLARCRDFDEPFVWEPAPSAADVADARKHLHGQGLSLVQGGRFWHLTGENDKGRAVAWVLEVYRSQGGRRPVSLSLGDSENDIPMLRATDRGVLVERPGGGHLACIPSGVLAVSGVGPTGWGPAVSRWLREMGFSLGLVVPGEDD